MCNDIFTQVGGTVYINVNVKLTSKEKVSAGKRKTNAGAKR